MSNSTLLAVGLPNTWEGWLGVIVIFVAMLFVGFALLLITQYKRCRSNQILVIWGRGRRAGQATKTIHLVANWPRP